MTPCAGGWWTSTCRRPDQGPTIPSSSTAASRCPIPALPGSRTGSTAPRGSSTTSAFPWTDGRWQRRALGRPRSLYELHVGTFTPEGTFEAAIARLDHLVDARRHPRRADARRRVPGASRLGLRRRRPVRPPPRLRRPRGAQAPGRRLPRQGLAVLLDVVYNHLGPAGQLPRPLRPVLHRPPPDALGPGGQSRRPGQRRGAPLLLRQRPDVAARLPPRRPAPRRRARHHRHLGHALPRTARGRGGRPRGAPRPPPGAHRRERPERSARRARAARSAATASTRSGATTSTTPCTPCSPASGPGYYADFGALADLAKALTERASSTTAATPRFRDRRTAGRRPALTGASLRRLPAEPRPDRQPRPGRAQQPSPQPRAA